MTKRTWPTKTGKPKGGKIPRQRFVSSPPNLAFNRRGLPTIDVSSLIASIKREKDGGA
jgi:hypothetical protein